MARIVDQQHREIRALRSLVDLAGRDILDIGCGRGRLTLQMADLATTVVGIDTDVAAIAEARRALADAPCGKVSFVIDDVSTTSAAWDQAFDVVVFSRSL